MKKTILTCLMVAFSTLFSLAQDSNGLLEVGTVATDLVSGGRVFSLEQFRGKDGKVSITDAKITEFYDHFNSTVPLFKSISHNEKHRCLLPISIHRGHRLQESLRRPYCY